MFQFLLLQKAKVAGSAIGSYEFCNRIKNLCNNCRIKKCESINIRKKTEHHKILWLAKSKLNSIEVLICKALIDSNISKDEFILLNNMLNEYDNIKEEIKI